MATVNENSIVGSELDPVTQQTLDAFRRRRGMLIWLRATGIAVLVFITLALFLATIDYLFFLSDGVRWCVSLMIWIATAATAWFVGVTPSRQDDALSIARHVEATAPEMRENLLSAVELSNPADANGSGYFRRLLQTRVAKQASKLDVRDLLPLGLVRRWVLSGGAVVALCIALMFVPTAQFGRRLARAALPGMAIERASRTKINIVEPSPPSRYVAQRDAIGVVAFIQGARPDDVMMEWRAEDGTAGETPMTPRMNASDFLPGGATSSSSDGDLASGVRTAESSSGQRFAANLSVGSVPLQYRILAGDAITLWHTLTPLPRPRVIQYDKVYEFPKYAQLDNRIASEEHGDLEALQGTTAELTVTFDQPVETPVLRFGFGGPSVQLEPADESATQFKTRVSIKTSGQYQVDANSIESGLNNPFSPSHTITPVLDMPPSVAWGNEVQTDQLVSSLDVLNLTAVASDDLPLDAVFQEFSINDNPFQKYTLPIDASARELNLAWSWDLLHRMGPDSETPKLESGDFVRVRLAAIDRKGNRTESRTLELLVAGDGFDANRHDFLQPLGEQSKNVAAWADKIKDLADTVRENDKNKQAVLPADWRERWKELQAESVTLVRSINQSLPANQNPASATITELIGRGVLDVDTLADGPFQRLDWLSRHQGKDYRKTAERHHKECLNEIHRVRYQAERLAEVARWRFSMGLSAALYADARTFRQSIDGLVAKMPRDRLPRYIALISGRLAEIDRLVERYEQLLPDRTTQHLAGEHWLRWSQRWQIQLQMLIDEDASRDQMAAVLRSLRDQSRDKPQHVIDSNAVNEMVRFGRDLRREMRTLSDMTRELKDAGSQWINQQNIAKQEKNADKVAVAELESQYFELLWQNRQTRLFICAGGQEKLNRSRAKVDLQYASDQSLFQRAIRNVTANGYQDYKDERADVVLNSIADAIRMLEACGDATNVKETLFAITEGERQADGSPLRKLYHPMWFTLQATILERSTRNFRDARLDWQREIEPFDRLRYNETHKQITQRFDRRRWSQDEFVSASVPLTKTINQLSESLTTLQPHRDSARELLKKYVLSISEQAREAAEAAKEAKKKTDEREASDEQATARLEEDQKEAVDKATQTIQSLIDKANTSEITNADDREEARDADAAAELVADAVRQAQKQLKQVQESTSQEQRDQQLESAEEKLEQLADRLEQTAEHFEKLESGEDVSESREALRQAEQQLPSTQNLQDRYEQAEEMADAANQDPRELLRQLEEELRQNVPMQDALSDISKDLVKEAAQNLEQAAQEERNLRRQLETNDRAFAEKKRQKQLMLDEFVARALSLRDQTLRTASDAAEMAQERQLRDQINQMREQLTEATDRAREAVNEQTTLDDVQNAANQMKRDLQETAQKAEAIADQLREQAEKSVHEDEKRRNAIADRLQQRENQLKNEEVSAIDQQRKRWQSHQRAAGNRVNSAEQQKRRSRDAARRAEGRLKKQPDNQSLKDQISAEKAKEENAERNAQEARNTAELAKQRSKDAVARSNALNQNKTQKLEKPNPAAELSEKVTRKAAAEMTGLAEELKSLHQESEFGEALQADTQTAKNLEQSQENVEDSVRETAENLARASRHEERLENNDGAEQLQQASQQTEQNAVQPAENATDELAETVKENDNASEAGEALGEAAEQIARQAERLSGLAATSENQEGQQEPNTPQSTSADPSQNPAMQSSQDAGNQSADGQQGQTSQQAGQSSQNAQGGPTSEAESARQKAQTLDELDRSIAEQESQSGSQNQSGSDEQSGQKPNQGNEQSASDSSSQPNGRPSDQSSSQTARNASPTLQQMLEAQMQQAARERMKNLEQMRQGDLNGNQPSDQNSANPNSISGQGEPPAGSDDVNLIEGQILDGQWGALRERGVDDANQSRASRIPRGYKREVQAYFKAISKRAAEKERSGSSNE